MTCICMKYIYIAVREEVREEVSITSEGQYVVNILSGPFFFFLGGGGVGGGGRLEAPIHRTEI